MRADRASSTILKEGERYARNPNYSRDHRSGDYCNPVVAILTEGISAADCGEFRQGAGTSSSRDDDLLLPLACMSIEIDAAAWVGLTTRYSPTTC